MSSAVTASHPPGASASLGPRGVAVWLIVAAVTLEGGSAVEAVGLPAPHLLTGLVAGLIVALSGLAARTHIRLPRPAYLAAQAIAGVLLGTYFSLSALASDGWNILSLIAVTVLTLGLSVGAGLVLTPRSDLDAPTATLGMIEPPEWLREPAFVIIGLQVGLGFDRVVVRRVARLAPQALPLIFGLIAICGLLARGLSAVTSTSLLNAYLALTPGGINAVPVTVFAAGANTSLVFAIQGLRLVLMVAAAPPLVAWVLKRHEQRRAQSGVRSAP